MGCVNFEEIMQGIQNQARARWKNGTGAYSVLRVGNDYLNMPQVLFGFLTITLGGKWLTLLLVLNAAILFR